MKESISSSTRIPLLVVSCDRYSDIWKPFFAIFHKRWPDCPYPLYLGANHKIFPDETVTTISVGEDFSWAESLRRMIDRLSSKYVILFLEDFFLLDPVNTPEIEKLVQLAQTEQTGCLRLFSILPPPHRLEKHPGLGFFSPGDDYRVTLQAAIWRVDTLKSLLVPGFNPWEFEILGNKLSENLDDRFWCVTKPVIRYEQVVEKGKWKPVGLEICKKAGVEIEPRTRPVFTEEDLREHYRSGATDSPYGQRYAIKRAMLEAFRNGHRSEGLNQALRYLKRRPLSIPVILGAAFGLLGAGALSRLIRFHLRCQLAVIGCRHWYAHLRLRLRKHPHTESQSTRNDAE